MGTTLDAAAARPGLAPAARPGAWRATLRRFARRWTALLGALLLLLAVGAAVLAPVIAPYPPTRMSARERLQGPSPAHPLGTDESGRDLLSRILFGARISLAAAAAAAAISLAVGVPLGLVAGFRGGAVDDAVMRVLDGFLAVPSILLALLILTALGPSLPNAIVAIGVQGVPLTARVTRAAVMVERNREYITAARVLGATDRRVIARALLPNCLPSLIVVASLLAANAILVEAALSFLGLGVQPPDASWGALLQLGYGYMAHSVWYVTFPGVAIFLVVWSLNVLGDALRDDLDPRLRGL